VNEIQAAIQLLDAYHKRLNRSTRKCSHCGTVQRVNWKEFQRSEQVEGIIHKLERWLAEENAQDEAESRK
jgi:hypothetical protein